MADSNSARSITAIDDESVVEAIIEAISNLTNVEVFSGAAGDDLGELSSQTVFDGIEANPEGVFQSKDGKRFEATATVYVTLNYGGKSEAVSMPDSYPALVTGEILPGGKIQVENVDVDTSSFYADE
jgi:hypothetical protein